MPCSDLNGTVGIQKGTGITIIVEMIRISPSGVPNCNFVKRPQLSRLSQDPRFDTYGCMVLTHRRFEDQYLKLNPKKPPAQDLLKYCSMKMYVTQKSLQTPLRLSCTRCASPHLRLRPRDPRLEDLGFDEVPSTEASRLGRGAAPRGTVGVSVVPHVVLCCLNISHI